METDSLGLPCFQFTQLTLFEKKTVCKCCALKLLITDCVQLIKLSRIQHPLLKLILSWPSKELGMFAACLWCVMRVICGVNSSCGSVVIDLFWWILL